MGCDVEKLTTQLIIRLDWLGLGNSSLVLPQHWMFFVDMVTTSESSTALLCHVILFCSPIHPLPPPPD